MVLLASVISFGLITQVLCSGCNKGEITNDTHGNLVFYPADTDTIPNGGSVSVHCRKPGYQSSGGTGRTIRCLDDKWQGQIDTCQPAKCLIKHLDSVLSDLVNGSIKYNRETDGEAAENGTLVSWECDEGYQMIKKISDGQYREIEYSDNDAFFCHYSVWVGRKPSDLGYKCVPIGKQLLIIGGLNSNNPNGLNTVELYDIEDPMKNKVLDIQLSGNRYGHMSAIFDNGIIVIAGGKKNGAYTSDTEFYDPVHNKTFPGPTMIEKRCYAGSAMVNNEMIICGGFNDGMPLATCEKLSDNEATGKFSHWMPFQSMNVARYSHAMTQYNKDLFVIGGFNSSGMADTASHYNHTANTWNSIDPMGIVRSQLAAAGLDGYIYACGGGQAQSGPLASMKLCQKYNPESATWSNATSMNTATIGLAMISVDGKLYSFTGSPNKVVEYYDPTSNNWTIAEKPMQKVRKYAGVVQLKSYLQYSF